MATGQRWVGELLVRSYRRQGGICWRKPSSHQQLIQSSDLLVLATARVSEIHASYVNRVYFARESFSWLVMGLHYQKSTSWTTWSVIYYLAFDVHLKPWGSWRRILVTCTCASVLLWCDETSSAFLQEALYSAFYCTCCEVSLTTICLGIWSVVLQAYTFAGLPAPPL